MLLLRVEENNAGRSEQQRNSAEMAQEQEVLRKTLEIMYKPHRKLLEQNTRQMIEQGPGEQAQAVMREIGVDPKAWQAQLRGSLEKFKKADQPVQIEFFHCDHAGTPLALTNRDGDITWAARFDPWGNMLEEYNPNGIEQNIRLPGQYHDRETNLYYNRYRYYDPKIGAYINQDPIGLAGGVNFYTYANSDPIGWADPLGLICMSDEFINGVAGAVGGAISGAQAGAALGTIFGPEAAPLGAFMGGVFGTLIGGIFGVVSTYFTSAGDSTAAGAAAGAATTLNAPASGGVGGAVGGWVNNIVASAFQKYGDTVSNAAGTVAGGTAAGLVTGAGTELIERQAATAAVESVVKNVVAKTLSGGGSGLLGGAITAGITAGLKAINNCGCATCGGK